MDGGRHLERWQRAGLVDAAAVARVRAFEASQPASPAGRLGVRRAEALEPLPD